MDTCQAVGIDKARDRPVDSQPMRKGRKPYRAKVAETRRVKFQLRLTDEEYKLLVQRASSQSKTLAAYLREKALT